MCKKGEGRCVTGIYDKRVYFFKILKLLRRDLSLDNLQSLTRDLTKTLQSFFDAIHHCYEDPRSVSLCRHAQFHQSFLKNLEAMEVEMVDANDDTEGFRFFVYKSLVNYLLHANLVREEAGLHKLS